MAKSSAKSIVAAALAAAAKSKVKPALRATEPSATPMGILRHPAAMLLEPKKFRRGLGLDFGTHCGYAYCDYYSDQAGRPLQAFVGQFDLSLSDWDSGPMRLVRLQQFLDVILPDIIFFEDVKNVPVMPKGVTATQILARVATSSELLGAFRAAVGIWAEANNVPMTGFGIGTIKKFATGVGNAGKEQMISACNARYGTTYDPATYEKSHCDNEVDALFVLEIGMESYADGLPH